MLALQEHLTKVNNVIDVYEINHIRSAEMKKNDPRSCERDLCKCLRSLKKNTGLQRDLNL